MNEFIEKMIGRLEELYNSNDKMKKKAYEEQDWENFELFTHGNEGVKESIEIVKQLTEEYNNGWIPCSEELPPQPEENTLFDNKPLELYLVSMGSGYPWRAFWNGEFFTDGWSKVEPKAWQPLPPDYQPKGE